MTGSSSTSAAKAKGDPRSAGEQAGGVGSCSAGKTGPSPNKLSAQNSAVLPVFVEGRIACRDTWTYDDWLAADRAYYDGIVLGRRMAVPTVSIDDVLSACLGGL